MRLIPTASFGIGLLLLLALRAAAEDASAEQVAFALADIKHLTAAMGNLQFDCGELPSNGQGLQALMVDPEFKGWTGPYLPRLPGSVDGLPKDPWKSSYRYKLTKTSFEIRSAGPDKKFETSDDILLPLPKPKK